MFMCISLNFSVNAKSGQILEESESPQNDADDIDEMNKDTFSLKIDNKNVAVTVQDDDGVEHAVPDLDLKIRIPKEKILEECRKSEKKFKLIRYLLSKIHRKEDRVIVIRDTVTVKDEKGRMYDLEMDLKVPEEDVKKIKAEEKMKAKKQSKSCMNVPWKKSKKNLHEGSIDDNTDNDSGIENERYKSTENVLSNWFHNGNKVKKSKSMINCSNKQAYVESHPMDTMMSDNNQRRSTMDLFRFTTV